MSTFLRSCHSPESVLRRVAGAALSCVVCVLAACDTLPKATSQTAIPPKEAERDFRPSDIDFAKLGYRRDWTGFPHVARSDPAVKFILLGSDLILVQDSSSTVTALDGSNGSRRWTTTVANPLTRFHGLLRDDGKVYSVSESEAFGLDLATGSLLTRQQFDRLTSALPALIDVRMVYGTGDGRVLGHNLLVNVGEGGNSMDGAVRTSPILVGDALGVVSESGSVMFLDPATLRLMQRGRMYKGTTVPLAASESLLFVASEDQSLYAFSPHSREPVWSYLTQEPLRSPPVYADGVVYCEIPGEGITAFGADAGDKRWTAKGVKGRIIGRQRGRLIAWDGSSAVTLDPASGDVVDRATLPGLSHVMLDRFDGGNLYVVTRKGAVGKFAPAR